MLVPEISLTPQTVERFRRGSARWPCCTAILSDAERHRHWQRIAEGEVSVVVGARSAVFAPTPNLGLIVLDEEHEASFKQETAPRYHARDVAIERAQAEGVPLVLGSATPSLESWHRAQHGRVPAGRDAAPRASTGRCRRSARSTCATNAHRGSSRRRIEPAAARGHARRAGRRRPGDPALESPRLFDAHPMPGLRHTWSAARTATSR